MKDRNVITGKNKELLIKHLCMRLPYAVTVEHTSGFRGTLHDIVVHHMYDNNDNIYDAICYTNFFGDEDNINIEYFKPYLFPITSVTKEQWKELRTLINIGQNNNNEWMRSMCKLEFYLKNHIDYDNLIEKGLALDATNKNIY